jgi:hypothetical protein
MNVTSIRQQAQFETTKRLVSQLINERLATASLDINSSATARYICITCPPGYDGPASKRRVKACVRLQTPIVSENGSILSLIRPQNLEPSIFLYEKDQGILELAPKAVFQFISPWLMNSTNRLGLQRVEAELETAAMFQGECAWNIFQLEEASISNRHPAIQKSGSREIWLVPSPVWDQVLLHGSRQ